MAEDWGPWIDHDGRGCPRALVGLRVRVDWLSPLNVGRRLEGTVTPDDVQVGGAWDWRLFKQPVPDQPNAYWGKVIRYRIWKPKALADLKRLIADLPEKVDA